MVDLFSHQSIKSRTHICDRLICVNCQVGRGILRLRNHCGQSSGREHRKKSETDSDHGKTSKMVVQRKRFPNCAGSFPIQGAGDAFSLSNRILSLQFVVYGAD
jgi:hypothetical protein